MRKLEQAKRWILTLLVLSVFPTASFAINFNPESVNGLAQAYGFILGQEYSLSLVAKEFPELCESVELVRRKFAATFPDIEAKLEIQLKNAMGDELFHQTARNLKKELREAAERQQITKETAVSFIERVDGRSRAEVESPILEYLLTVKYATDPAGEFHDGFRQPYRTEGGGKSQGIQLNLQLPRSWASKEGDRPHIVRKWVSANGTGLEIVLLDIRDAQGYNPTRAEMEEFVRSGEVKETVPEGSTYVASGNFTIEMRAGYWVQMTMPVERAEMKLYQELVMYQFFFRGKAIGLMCQASGPVTDEGRVNQSFKRIRPLCQQIVNSLVLTQAY